MTKEEQQVEFVNSYRDKDVWMYVTKYSNNKNYREYFDFITSHFKDRQVDFKYIKNGKTGIAVVRKMMIADFVDFCGIQIDAGERQRYKICIDSDREIRELIDDGGMIEE